MLYSGVYQSRANTVFAISGYQKQRILQSRKRCRLISDQRQPVPKKNFQMVRYYGWYSNKSRGMRAKAEIVADNFNNDEKNLEENVIPEVLKMIKNKIGDKAYQKLQAKSLPTLLKVVGKYANLHAVEGAKKIADMSIKHFTPVDTSIDRK